MRIAFIDHLANPGGGVRFVRKLLDALIKTSEVELTFLTTKRGWEGEYRDVKGVEVKILAETRKKRFLGIPGTGGSRIRLMKKFGIDLYKKTFYSIQEKIKEGNFDVIYCAWPYFIPCPEAGVPVVCTYHDFIWKRYIPGVLDETTLRLFEGQADSWFEKSSRVIVSSEFMRNEVMMYYPDYAPGKIQKIYLAPFIKKNYSYEEARAVIKRFNLPEEYILCPTNVSPHKNLDNLLIAFAKWMGMGKSIPLVVTGAGTESIPQPLKGRSPRLTKIYHSLKLERWKENIFFLGYVPDEVMDALIKSATFIVSPSLYEAGSGPGVDGWASGVPVILSDIPSHREHEQLGFEIDFFNPVNPESIVEVIVQAWENREGYGERIEKNKELISSFRWENVGRAYLEVMKSAIERRANEEVSGL